MNREMLTKHVPAAICTLTSSYCANNHVVGTDPKNAVDDDDAHPQNGWRVKWDVFVGQLQLGYYRAKLDIVASHVMGRRWNIHDWHGERQWRCGVMRCCSCGRCQRTERRHGLQVVQEGGDWRENLGK